jgi:hypothetical protein
VRQFHRRDDAIRSRVQESVMHAGESTGAVRIPARRFTILDAIVLVAAMAPGLAVLRARGLEFWAPRGGGLQLVLDYAYLLLLAIRPFLMGLSSAALILGLIRPRHEARLLFRQAGMAASAAATLGMAADILPYLAFKAIARWITGGGDNFVLAFLRVQYAWSIPVAIEGAWAALALGGRWRRGRGWVDGLGIRLGVAWIALQVVEAILTVGSAFAGR